MADAKEQVKTATTEALTATFAVNGNRDITKFLPALIGCIARPVRGQMVKLKLEVLGIWHWFQMLDQTRGIWHSSM